MHSFKIGQTDTIEDSGPSHLAVPLGIALNTEIKMIMNCLIRVKKKELGVFPFEQIVLCVGTERIFIFTEKLDKIKFDFGYQNVKYILCEKNPSTSLLIELQGVEHKRKNIPSIYLSIPDRNQFIEIFATFYSAFYAGKTGELRELAITYTEEIVFVNHQYTTNEKYMPLMHSPPEFYKLLKYRNYYFFGTPDLEVLNPFTFSFTYLYKINESSKIKVNCKMFMKWTLEKDTHALGQNETSNLQIYTQNELLSHINKNYTGNVKFYFYKDEEYVKKYNLTEDSAIWQGWQTRCMLVVPHQLNLIFTNIRRKFIPPFFESFSDFGYFCILDLSALKPEELTEFQKSEHEELNKKIDIIIDSLYIEKVPNYMDFKNIIAMKYDSLSLDRKTMKHLNNLGMKGYETYKLGVSFIIYVINEVLLKQATSKDTVIRNLYENFKIFKELTLSEFQSANLKDVSLKLPENEDQLLAASKDFQTVFSNFRELINADISNELYSKEEDYKLKIIEAWDKRVYEYLLFCLDGGIMGECFDLKILFHCMNIDEYIKSVMTDLILKMLIKNPVEGENIGYCISSYKNIIRNVYTESLLSSVIRHYSVEKLFKFTDISKFLSFLIEERCSYSLLKAILKHFETFFAHNLFQSTERIKYFSTFFELKNGLVKIYKEDPSLVNPIISTIACKILIFLTSHSSKLDLAESLINLDIYTLIAKKLLTHDRGLIEQSVILLSTLSEKMELKNSSLVVANNKILMANMNECIYSVKYFSSKLWIIRHILKALENFLKSEIEAQNVIYLEDKTARDKTGMVTMTSTQVRDNTQASTKESNREIKNKIMETITNNVAPFNIPYNLIYEVLLYPTGFEINNTSILQNSKRWVVEIHCYTILHNLIAHNNLSLKKYLADDLQMFSQLSTKKIFREGKNNNINYYQYLTDVYLKSVNYFYTHKAYLKQKKIERPSEDPDAYLFEHFTRFLQLCTCILRFYRHVLVSGPGSRNRMKQDIHLVDFNDFISKIDEDVNGLANEEGLINYLDMHSKTKIVKNFKGELEIFKHEFKTDQMDIFLDE